MFLSLSCLEIDLPVQLAAYAGNGVGRILPEQCSVSKRLLSGGPFQPAMQIGELSC